MPRPAAAPMISGTDEGESDVYFTGPQPTDTVQVDQDAEGSVISTDSVTVAHGTVPAAEGASTGTMLSEPGAATGGACELANGYPSNRSNSGTPKSSGPIWRPIYADDVEVSRVLGPERIVPNQNGQAPATSVTAMTVGLDVSRPQRSSSESPTSWVEVGDGTDPDEAAEMAIAAMTAAAEASSKGRFYSMDSKNLNNWVATVQAPTDGESWGQQPPPPFPINTPVSMHIPMPIHPHPPLVPLDYPLLNSGVAGGGGGAFHHPNNHFHQQLTMHHYSAAWPHAQHPRNGPYPPTHSIPPPSHMWPAPVHAAAVAAAAASAAAAHAVATGGHAGSGSGTGSASGPLNMLAGAAATLNAGEMDVNGSSEGAANDQMDASAEGHTDGNTDEHNPTNNGADPRDDSGGAVSVVGSESSRASPAPARSIYTPPSVNYSVYGGNGYWGAAPMNGWGGGFRGLVGGAWGSTSPGVYNGSGVPGTDGAGTVPYMGYGAGVAGVPQQGGEFASMVTGCDGLYV